MRHAKPLPVVTARDKEFFYARVDKQGGMAYCWLWNGAYTKGRPVMWIGPAHERVVFYTHRWSCLAFNGDPPNRFYDACHTCDNKRCVNPEHLYWGTNSNNRCDWEARGDTRKHKASIPKGSNNGQSKLNEELVRLIKLDADNQYDVARKYGVAQSQISRIRAGKTWSHV